MTQSSAGIAIVGIAAQLPGGHLAEGDLDYASFFDFLLQGGQAYGPIPPDRFNAKFLRGTALGRVATDSGAFLKDIHDIDYLEFGIGPKDAHLMPLSTRKLLEVSFLSLQDSGIDYRGRNVGCYMAGVAFDTFSLSGHDDIEAKGSFAYGPAMLANRVSYHLDLRGPSIPLDTACSSTLYATHLAVQALLSGECEAALVGGSQINHRFTEWLSYTQGGLLSPDGKCKPFDASANGFGRGEGIVVMVLKPLQAAIRDHDHVYATILGTGVNSSGALVPANAPAADAQRDAMLRAFDQAHRDPRDVDFLELHATGTAQGDPTEANWVGQAFKRDDDLLIGSVKGNVGHLEITAFLASLCKVCGIFSSGIIPPNVNLHNPNPAIKWSDLRLRVPLKQEPIQCRTGNGRPLIAMTSSGIGGANGHAVVEGPPSPEQTIPFWTTGADTSVLLIAAALSPRSVSALGEALLVTASGSAEAAALARLAGRRARSMTWRSFAVAGSGKPPAFSKPIIVPKTRPPIVFVFSGQGTQHFHMGRVLYRTCAPFRESILELDKVYASVVGTSLLKSTGLFDDSPKHLTDALGDPWPIAITLPALTMLQLALVDALAVAGVHPDVVVGHSAGETAVLSASGAASKIVALRLAIARGRALSLLEDAKGTMAAVSCSPKQAQAIIDEVNADLGQGVLEVGCYNTAGAVTLSGEETHVELAVAKATAAGIFARRLKTRIPVHSAMMELCRAEFMHLLADIFPADADACIPKVATYSTVTGGLFDGAMDTQYYWDGTLKPVLFQDAIEAMLPRYKGATFVEIGPHPVLTGYLRTMAEGIDNITITCPLRRARMPTPGTEVAEFLTALGSIVAAGHNCVDFDALYGSAGRFSGVLPKYPFVPKSVPWVVSTPEILRQRQHRNGPLNYPQLRVNAKTHPELADHVIKGEPIMPASGFIEMALEFGATELYDVSFHRLLPLSSDRPTPVNIELHGNSWSINTTSTADADAWPIQYDRRHATGFLSMEPSQDLDMQKMNIESIRASMKPAKISEVYSGIAHFLQYGPLYRRIQECHTATRADGTVEALVKIKGRGDDLPNIADYVFHPAILDAAIHIVAHPMMTGNYDRDLYHLPDKVSAFRTTPRLREGAFPDVLYARATTVSWAPENITFDIIITDQSGLTLCKIERLEVARHGYSRAAVLKRYDLRYESTSLVLPVHCEETSLSISASSSHSILRELSYGDDTSNVSAIITVSPSAAPSSTEWDDATWSTDGSSDCGSNKCSSLIIDYARGSEMKLQGPLAELDPREHASLLFVATEGLDGDAALGFTRSLRKEYPAWTVRVATFSSSLTSAQQLRCSKVLAELPATELEMSIDKDGTVRVPRITLSSAPSERVPFDPFLPWVIQEGDVIHTHLPGARQDRRIVHVTSVHRCSGPVWAFVGTLYAHGSESAQVTGISASPFCSHLEVHYRSIVDYCHVIAASSNSCRSVLAPTIAALAVDPTSFADPVRLHMKRVLVFASSDMDVHLEIQTVLSEVGMEAILVTSLTTSVLTQLYTRKPHFIISGTRNRDEMALLRSVLLPDGQAFFWNDPEVGIARVLRNSPWLVGDALRAALQCTLRPASCGLLCTPLLMLEEVRMAKTAQPPSLFDPHKVYLLVGGIGSLGMHISLWMYENGARHIVVTSRSGPESLRSRGDFIAKRILDYLYSRQDLVLRACAAGATCAEELKAVLEGISAPLGGAFILSGLLNDRSFASQTQETFDSVFPPKVDALATLASVTDIASLDFCIPFSSVSGMFGNPGQTSYAAANTALCGMTHGYPNAFCMVCPIILDSRILTLTDDTYNSRVRHITQWGMTARELCGYIGDGIRKLKDGPVWQYIPDFDWRVVRDSIGSSQLYDHLILHQQEVSTEGSASEKPSVVHIVCKVLDLQEAEISVDVPLTAYGLDSLSASSLSYALRSHVSVSQLQLLADLTIANIQSRMENEDPNASQVASPSPIQCDPSSLQDAQIATHVSEMHSLLDELSATMSARSWTPDAPTNRQSQVALVTGTTGSLGSHVLAELLATPGYDKVVALVRPGRDNATARERQIAAFTERGLDASILDSPRILLVDCPFDGERLGLDPDVYEELRRSVSHIVHVGWPVNFDLPLSSFKSTLFALRSLLDFASEALQYGPVSVLYGSSSGIFRNYFEPIPPAEQPVDAHKAVGHGYSESKWVAEQLVRVATERTPLRTTIVRIGQLTGSATGVWNSSEWLPAMISASTVLGSLPEGYGPVSWLPVQNAASAIVEFVGTESSHSIVHLRHPQPVSWSDIMGHFSSILDLPTIDYQTWISMLSTIHERPGTHNTKYVNTAISLLSVLQARRSAVEVTDVPATENNGLSVLMGLGDSSMRCSILRNPSMKQLGLDDVKSWVEHWRRIGSLPPL